MSACARRATAAIVRAVRIAVGTDEETDVVEALRAHVAAAGHTVTRAGGDAEWPEVGRAVAQAVARGDAEVGIVCCFTGTGVAMAANKVAGIRCALCVDAATAEGARRWNDANVLALSLRLASVAVVAEIVDAFLATPADADTAAATARLEQSR